MTLLVLYSACKNVYIFRRVRKVAEKDCLLVCHVRPCGWNNSAPTGWIFMKFDV